jgi:PPOX class probable F420-dependent enzyme
VPLSEDDCWARVRRARHGVLATIHPTRGADLVPVVYAVAGREILLPIDTVKPKRGTRLARQANLARDRRCALLVDHYSEDWNDLWWVRIHASGEERPLTSAVREVLAGRYPQYRAPGSVSGLLVLVPTVITGWAAGTMVS